MVRQPTTLIMEPGRDGGYVVREFDRCEGRSLSAFLFAGDLEPCLDYVREHFDPDAARRPTTAETVAGFVRGRS